MGITKREADNLVKFLSKLFNVFDVNSDCFVSLDEALHTFEETGLAKDYQLAVELVIRPKSALARFLALTVIDDADQDKDSELSLTEFLNFFSPCYIDKLRMVTDPILESQNNFSV